MTELHSLPTIELFTKVEARKRIWSPARNGPWDCVEAAAKTFLEARGWYVSYGITDSCNSLLRAACWTGSNAGLTGRKLEILSSGQELRVDTKVRPRKFTDCEVDAFRQLQSFFKSSGFEVEGPLQLFKIVAFPYIDEKPDEIKERVLSSIENKVNKLQYDKIKEGVQTLFDKLFKIGSARSSRQGYPLINIKSGLDRDLDFIKLRSYVCRGGFVDIDGWASCHNEKILDSAIVEYKRNVKSYNIRAQKSGLKPIGVLNDRISILGSADFQGNPLVRPSLAGLISPEVKYNLKRILADLGIETVFEISMGDIDKFESTEHWLGKGQPDLYASKGRSQYFVEIKSPNDRPSKAQKDFSKFVSGRVGIPYVFHKIVAIDI